MSKYVVSVGDVSDQYFCFAWFDCCDVQEVLECFNGVGFNEIKDYTLVLGENILDKAFWNSNGECYGDMVTSDYVLKMLDEVLHEQGLSLKDLHWIIEFSL